MLSVRVVVVVGGGGIVGVVGVVGTLSVSAQSLLKGGIDFIQALQNFISL